MGITQEEARIDVPIERDKYRRGQSLRARAHAAIPGGCHTYAKGDDQYPALAPPFITRGLGCTVWDLDGNPFIEYGMGLRAVTLGHAYPSVVAAVTDALGRGTNFTRPAPIEVECAEALLAQIGWADQVKFAKDGSTVTTAAVKLARAHTGRDLVAVCADHPFLSYNDWFFSITPMTSGIPEAVRKLTVTFRYNDLASVERLFAEHPRQIAGLILEAARVDEPAPGFLSGLKRLCEKNGAVLIFDEIITGFRWSRGGASAVYGVTPHLATFGKALANGFSLSALVGMREIMELGGGSHARERVFLLSTTHGAETHSLAAALATMKEYAERPVIETLYERGAQLRDGVLQAARRHGLQDHFGVVGRPCNLLFSTADAERKPSQSFRALFLQELIRNGVIAPSFVVSFSHSKDHIERTIEAVDASLKIYSAALADGVDRFLVGPPVKPVYRKFN
jgi:glutamate-1-semialdehyde 2,1-aminomutase